mgnify:CR=1 FL=1
MTIVPLRRALRRPVPCLCWQSTATRAMGKTTQAIRARAEPRSRPMQSEQRQRKGYLMGFKIPGPKGAALGAYKPQCEAWVDAFVAGDQFKAEQVRKAIEAQPKSKEKDIALAYLDKKAKVGVQSRSTAEAPARKTPIDTMRLAVNLLALSRKPFAEALLEAVQADKVTEAILQEIKMVCDSAIVAVKRHSEFRDIFKVPDSIK